MKHFRKLLATLALVSAMTLPSHADDGKDYSLVMYTADGTRTAYALGDHPRLTISSSTFTVITNAEKTDYALPNLRRFLLEDSEGDAVENVYWLVISLRDGTIEGIPFTDRPKITINDDKFSVKSAAHNVDYVATNVGSFRVTDHFDADSSDVNADTNGDGSVDVADISAVISVMAGGAEASSTSTDVNGDGIVDVADIAAIISVMAGNPK